MDKMLTAAEKSLIRPLFSVVSVPQKIFASVFPVLMLSLLIGLSESTQGQGPVWQGYAEEGTATPNYATIPGIAPITDDPDVPRFFLLKTGLLMEATAIQGETHYEMKTEFGIMQVPIENVLFSGKDRNEVYQYKKSLVDPASCTQLMNLAEWCINNKMPEKGLKEYEAAMQVAPNNNLAAFVQGRLDSLRKALPLPIESGQQPLQGGESGIRPTMGHDTDPEMTNWANGIPKSVFETFTKKVQPILVQRCAAADCHGSNSDNQYKIKIPRQAGGRTTYSNLRSTLDRVDLENPGESPMLSAMILSHAGKKPIYSVESDQYVNAIEWIQLASKDLPLEYNDSLMARLEKQGGRNRLEKARIPETIRTDLLPKTLRDVMSDEDPSVMTAAYADLPGRTQNMQGNIPVSGEFLDPDQFKPTRLTVPNPPNPSQPQSKISNRLQDNEASDPFDPDAFNAKHHGAIHARSEKR